MDNPKTLSDYTFLFGNQDKNCSKSRIRNANFWTDMDIYRTTA